MEQDKNFMGYPYTMPNVPCYNMESLKYEDNMDKMLPYMCGKCMGMNDSMQCGSYIMPGYYNVFPQRGDMYMNPYQMQKIESLENMCSQTYKMLIVKVRKTIQIIIMENMGMMPTSISKEKFNKYLNDTICEVMKQEDDIKKMVVVERDETETEEENNRDFCPYCHGLLKDTIAFLLITELIKGGCTTCY